MYFKPIIVALAAGIVLLIGLMTGFIFGQTTIPESPTPPLEETQPAPSQRPSDSLSEPTEEPVFCTMDAKLCPDGSSVGRQPPNCEFAPCPGE